MKETVKNSQMAAGENRNGNDEIALLIDCVKCRFICVPFPAPHPALVCPAPRPLGVAAYYSEENMLLKARQKAEKENKFSFFIEKSRTSEK